MVLVFPGTFCSVQHALASSQTALMQRAQSTDNITPSPDKLFLELLSYAYVNGPLAQHQLPLLHTPQDEGKGPSSEQEAECVQLPYLCRLQNGSASHKQLTLRKGWIFCALSLSLLLSLMCVSFLGNLESCIVFFHGWYLPAFWPWPHSCFILPCSTT